MSGFHLAFSHVLERQRGRFGWVLSFVALSGVVLGSLIERARGTTSGPTDVLVGPVFGLVVPLAIFSIVRRVSGTGNLNQAIDACSIHGSSRRTVACGLIAGVALSAAVTAIALSSIALFLTRGVGDRALPNDLVTTGWIAALGATTYSTLFLWGAQMGKRGIGIPLFLIADWLLGSSATFAALPWPRAHIFNLLAGIAPLEMPPYQASLALIGLSLLYGAFFALRLDR
jgi:hypothetical protein